MRLALQTDYSLRTLMFLAARPGRHTVADVAGFFRISETHVGKVVHQLARLGFVRSIRGIGGGLELARSADDITIGEVIQAVEGNVHLLECISMPNVCVIQQHCKLRTVLDRAERIQVDYLKSVRLSDVLPFGQPVVTLSVPDAAASDAPPPNASKPIRKKSPSKQAPAKGAARGKRN
jgi:Rrf2 family nitric oxide-sensitive transcriptional repressor